MSSPTTASPGALGGAGAEEGSEYRARVGALLATAVLRSGALDDVGLPSSGAAAELLQVESDDPVDDLVVRLADGSSAYVQAKRRAGLTRGLAAPLGAAVRQFTRAVRRGLRDTDRLVLACARPSRDLRPLEALLSRRRLAAQGNSTAAERKALATVEGLASAAGATPEEIGQLLDHLVLWTTDPTAGDGLAALVARLEGHVVPGGEGRDAARELADEVRALARLRGGRDALQLAQALDYRGVPLLPDAPAGSPIGWATALAEHQRRAIRLGTTLALFGVPPELRDLPLEEADARIEVDVPEDDRRSGLPLERAARRRGRALLVGAPGGGKSTALRALAGHAADRPHWPVPVVVHLQRLAARSGPLLDALLDAAVEHVVSASGRAALRAGLQHELAAGRCLLLLDGLDEVRAGRAALVDDLERVLRDLPVSVEVVVATRPSALADARVLGLPELPLRPPDHPLTTVDAILEATAPDGAGDDWRTVRRRWVDHALKRDPALGTTPLTVVVLALVAARSADPADLPATRAAVLLRALTDVIDQWEITARHRGDVRIGPLTGSRARHALTTTLLRLSSAALAARPPTDAEAHGDLAEVLAEQFPLLRGDAQAAADDAVAFWTDVGLFSFDGKRLSTTIRQLAELGHAWGPVLERTPAPASWVAETRGTRDLWASLALAAGLSRAIATAWAEGVTQDGDVDEFIALVDAVGDGAQLPPQVTVALAEAMAARHLGVSYDAERTAEGLLALQLPAPIRARLRPALTDALPPERRTTVDALAIVRWDERGDDHDARGCAPSSPRPRHRSRATCSRRSPSPATS